MKSRDSSIAAESSMRLQNAEARLSELKSTMMALGKEATSAMLSVESQQQQKTFQKLLTMVFSLLQLCLTKTSCSIFIYLGIFQRYGILLVNAVLD